MAKYFEYAATAWAVAATLWSVYEHFYIVKNHKEEIGRLKGAIGALRDEKNSESTKLVERTLVNLKPPICRVCRELLLLRFSTNFNNALYHLDSLPTAVAQSSATRGVDMPLLLNTLHEAIHGKLWQTPLENPLREALSNRSI